MIRPTYSTARLFLIYFDVDETVCTVNENTIRSAITILRCVQLGTLAPDGSEVSTMITILRGFITLRALALNEAKLYTGTVKTILKNTCPAQCSNTTPISTVLYCYYDTRMGCTYIILWKSFTCSLHLDLLRYRNPSPAVHNIRYFLRTTV